MVNELQLRRDRRPRLRCQPEPSPGSSSQQLAIQPTPALAEQADLPQLNQVEVWFSILTRAVLRHLSATDPRQVRQAIARFTDARNEHPVPFDWTKSVVHPGGLKQRYADLR